VSTVTYCITVKPHKQSKHTFTCITVKAHSQSTHSLAGKFGQRSDVTTHKIFTDDETAPYFAVCFDETIELIESHILTPSVVLLKYKQKGQFVEALQISSEITAAFVTCHARLSLYDLLDLLQDRVVYCDTDSVIYSHSPGQPDLPTGRFLGELTNELDKLGPDAYIAEFVTGGPKNYGYKVLGAKDGKESTALKVKGLNLNYQACRTVNYETLKEMVLGYSQWGDQNPSHLVKFDQIRKREGGRVFTVPAEKTWRPVMDKRVVLPELTSRPFGF
jgi:hypothetical protein